VDLWDFDGVVDNDASKEKILRNIDLILEAEEAKIHDIACDKNLQKSKAQENKKTI
jgi:hypothetical protein